MFLQFIGSLILIGFVMRFVVGVLAIPLAVVAAALSRYEDESSAFWSAAMTQAVLCITYAGFLALVSLAYASDPTVRHPWLYSTVGFVATYLALGSNAYEIRKELAGSWSTPSTDTLGGVQGAGIGVLLGLLAYPMIYVWPVLFTAIPGAATLLRWTLLGADWLLQWWIVRIALSLGVLSYLLNAGFMALVGGALLVTAASSGIKRVFTGQRARTVRAAEKAAEIDEESQQASPKPPRSGPVQRDRLESLSQPAGRMTAESEKPEDRNYKPESLDASYLEFIAEPPHGEPVDSKQARVSWAGRGAGVSWRVATIATKFGCVMAALASQAPPEIAKRGSQTEEVAGQSWDIVVEFVAFLLHLTSRVVSTRIPSHRTIFVNCVAVGALHYLFYGALSPENVVDEELARESARELLDLFDEREQEYAAHALDGDLFWEFGKRIGETIGIVDDFYVAMEAAGQASSMFTALRLGERLAEANL